VGRFLGLTSDGDGRAQSEKKQLIRRLLRLPQWSGYQPVPRSLNAAECLQGVPAGRTDKTVRLARGRMELGPLVKRAARAGDLRGCHSGLGRPPNKGSGNNSRPSGLSLSALGGVERAEHPTRNQPPSVGGSARWSPTSSISNGAILLFFSKNSGLIPVAHHPSQHGRPASANGTSVLHRQ